MIWVTKNIIYDHEDDLQQIMRGSLNDFVRGIRTNYVIKTKHPHRRKLSLGTEMTLMEYFCTKHNRELATNCCGDCSHEPSEQIYHSFCGKRVDN